MIMMQLTGDDPRFQISPPQRRSPRVYLRPREPARDEKSITPLDIVTGVTAVAAVAGFAVICFAIA